MSQQHRYAIQCDKLQNREGGEAVWITLMNEAQRMALESLEDLVVLGDILDEGESLEDFVQDDPNAAAYYVDLPDQQIYILQKSGYEFFFTRDGSIPNYTLPDLEDGVEMRSSAQARLLLKASHPLTPFWGNEQNEGIDDEGLRVILADSGAVRFQLLIGDRPVAGARIEDNEITDIYVLRDERRTGKATELLNAIKRSYGPLRFSPSLTDDGKAFKAAYQKSKRREDDFELGF